MEGLMISIKNTSSIDGKHQPASNIEKPAFKYFVEECQVERDSDRQEELFVVTVVPDP